MPLGFGKFEVQARTGRNPATGATIAIAASNKLSFTSAATMRTALEYDARACDGSQV
jgi:DNA-binding protein HU-beta